MNLETFQPGSSVHWIALAVCLGLSVLLARRNRPTPLSSDRIILAVLCLVSWFCSIFHGLRPSVFQWEHSLPLHFCHVANLVAVVAILRQNRLAQALLYFWGIALCSWGLLTPSLTHGPATLWFWIFWFYHLCVPLGLTWILFVDRFRPTFDDLKKTLLVTFAFASALFVFNRITGWDYGFLGEGKPGQPSPIDFLGAYPMRVLWMLLIGATLFGILYLPWIRIHKISRT